MTDNNAQLDINQGFSQKILRYFLTFLQTDFKKQQTPRRRIQLQSDVGLRMGMPLRKYASLYKAIWKFVADAPERGLIFKIAPRQYTARISPTLRDLIRQHIDAIDTPTLARIAQSTIQYAKQERSKAVEHPEKFVDLIQMHFVEEVDTHIIQPLLAMLEGPFKESAYSAIESIHDLETDLTNIVTSHVLEHLSTAINTLIISGDVSPLQAIFDEFFAVLDIRAQAQSFFDDFATSDAFREIRDLQHSLRATENQSLYLYLCECRFGPHAFPLFYIPISLNYDESDRAVTLELDLRLLINKQAIDWILQERQSESTSLPISPVADRVLYINSTGSFLDEIEPLFARLLSSFDIRMDIDLRNAQGVLQQASSPTLKISNAAYFAIFDKSDESLLNDYEELLAAFDEEQQGAARLFDNIIQGFLFENPFSVAASIDAAWDVLDMSERLIANTPIPVNEEQRKILSALKDPKCNYVSVQGPPGTGKSHTITALAFEGILSGQSVLILSDKTEALDVVQDKLESVLSTVRNGDKDFPNPILRLGRSGNTFNRLVSASTKEKIKTYHQAATRHAQTLEHETVQTRAMLHENINKTVEVFCGMRLDDLNALHQLEAKINAIRPDLVTQLQKPIASNSISALRASLAGIDHSTTSSILATICTQSRCNTLAAIAPKLYAWQITAKLADSLGLQQSPALFNALEAEQLPILLECIAEYEALRVPILGWLFSKEKLQAINLRLGSILLCAHTTALHTQLDDLRREARILTLLSERLSKEGLENLIGFAYRLIKEGKTSILGVQELGSLVQNFVSIIAKEPAEADLILETEALHAPDTLFDLIIQASRYASLWHDIADRMQALPKSDYISAKTRLEQLNTARMTSEIDRRFLEFVDQKKATVKEISGIIKAKQKFPENEFHHLSDAFPVIIAGIREYAEYVPLKQRLFDLVVIDEASQVSVAQALPAVLRAKKVVVFGDAKQFSNVKSSQASNAINTSYLSDIETYFRANISDTAAKLQRLKYFNVKKSILEFFDLINNYQIMLRKHFRGYQALISFSSKYFYDGQLQAIKIRTQPIEDIIRFEVLESVPERDAKNVNRAEAEYILKELRHLIDMSKKQTVGVITPLREQVKVLNDVLYSDAYGERFESELRLKIMTFDTCQGEERDLIIYSMVATAKHDVLNYIFPVDLEEMASKAEDALKAQRLNVGFSRGKQAFLFVLSKPVDQFKGAIGRVLMHYKQIVERDTHPEALSADHISPIERKVLNWVRNTPFWHLNQKCMEVIPRFPIGEYLKQLDPFYAHPAYRADFLVSYRSEQGSINVIIEYDGFAEHFVERGKIQNGNLNGYYQPQDIERQMIIESYGYKFLRLNRFNLGENPVTFLSNRLYELVDIASKTKEDSNSIASIKEDALSIEIGSKKRCPKCAHIQDIQTFWDPQLKNGQGGYGRHCLLCKSKPKTLASKKPRKQPHAHNA